jgi:hypothetical protein
MGLLDTMVCKKCHRMFKEDGAEDDDLSVGTGLCYDCFEEGVEEYEERRRRKIAEQNEY